MTAFFLPASSTALRCVRFLLMHISLCCRRKRKDSQSRCSKRQVLESAFSQATFLKIGKYSLRENRRSVLPSGQKMSPTFEKSSPLCFVLPLSRKTPGRAPGGLFGLTMIGGQSRGTWGGWRDCCPPPPTSKNTTPN